jgi:hypothetical protein
LTLGQTGVYSDTASLNTAEQLETLSANKEPFPRWLAERPATSSSRTGGNLQRDATLSIEAASTYMHAAHQRR